MIIYLLIPLIILAFGKSINKNKLNITDCILMCFLFLVCGLRKNVGTDYILYTKMYNNIAGFPRVEYFFTELIKILNNIKLDVVWFFLICSFFTTILIYIGIKKNAKYPSESLLLYVCLGFYALQFNIIRQMLAIAIIFYAIKYIYERKFIKYLIFVFLAYLCHSTAIIMLPFYFICNMNLNRKKMIIIMVIMFVSSFFYNSIVNFVTSNFDQYSAYATLNSYTYDVAGIGTYIILFFNLILMLLIISKKDKLVKFNSKNNIYINLILFSFFFYFLSLTNTVMVRPAYYFFIFIIFLLPDLYRVSKLKVSSNNSVLFIIFFVFYYVVHLIFFNSMLPYNIIFFS